MLIPVWCPECNADISDTYQAYDPDVGIMNEGWYCEDCDLFVERDIHEDDPYDERI